MRRTARTGARPVRWQRLFLWSGGSCTSLAPPPPSPKCNPSCRLIHAVATPSLVFVLGPVRVAHALSTMPLVDGGLSAHRSVVDQLFDNGASRDTAFEAAFTALNKFVAAQAGRPFATTSQDMCSFLQGLK